MDSRSEFMPKGGLEPPCPFEHNALNVACLPISPLRLSGPFLGTWLIILHLLWLVNRSEGFFRFISSANF